MLVKSGRKLNLTIHYIARGFFILRLLETTDYRGFLANSEILCLLWIIGLSDYVLLKIYALSIVCSS